MQVELDTKEALFVAKALKEYAGERLENAKGVELMEAERTGRKVCAKFLDAVGDKGTPEVMELEGALDEARGAFCGIGNDSDL